MNPFKKTKKQLSIFTTFGFPSIESFDSQLDSFSRYGIDFIEVGIPFSDPLADGPTIQRSSDLALKNGSNLSLLYEKLNERKSELPIVLMGYFNPILHFGLERFLQACQQTRVAGVILPDISFEIYQHFYAEQFEQYDVKLIFLITPETSNERIAEIAEYSRDRFIYLVATSSTTGTKTVQLDNARISEIRTLCGETPIFIGFGIQNAQDLAAVHKLVDGAIVGSAYIKALERNEEELFLEELTSLVSV